MSSESLDLDNALTLAGNTGPELSRRELIALLGSAAVASVLTGCTRPPATAAAAGGDALADPVHYSSTRALARAIREKQVKSEEVVRACLDRIQAVNGKLNAVVQLQTDQALARARLADAALAKGDSWGPLHGVPMTIKDSFDTEGVISTGGTKGRASFVPERDATVVARAKRAGAILLGKTNTPELTLSFETNNLVYGRTSNPYDLARTPGGSSGGAAAIIAAGGAPFDIGSDYGGSIRLPSHFCGIAGIKPSSGRVPRTGHIYPFGGLQDAFQQIGPLARSVDDLSFLLPLIAGPDGIDPSIVPLPWRNPSEVDVKSLRISFHTDNGIRTPTGETIQTIQAVAKTLASAARVVEEARPPGVEHVMENGLPLYFWDGGVAVSRLLRAAGTTENTLQGFTLAKPLSAAQLDHLLEWLYAFRSGMHSFMNKYDAIVCPVNAAPAPLHRATEPPGALPAFSYTFTYNLTGWPGVVVRAGTSPEGMPIGVQIVALPGREDVALAVAKVIETEHGGFKRPML